MEKIVEQISNKYIEKFKSPRFQGDNFSWTDYAETIGDSVILTAITAGTFGNNLTKQQEQKIRDYAKKYTNQYLKNNNLI